MIWKLFCIRNLAFSPNTIKQNMKCPTVLQGIKLSRCGEDIHIKPINLFNDLPNELKILNNTVIRKIILKRRIISNI